MGPGPEIRWRASRRQGAEEDGYYLNLGHRHRPGCRTTCPRMSNHPQDARPAFWASAPSRSTTSRSRHHQHGIADRDASFKGTSLFSPSATASHDPLRPYDLSILGAMERWPENGRPRQLYDPRHDGQGQWAAPMDRGRRAQRVIVTCARLQGRASQLRKECTLPAPGNGWSTLVDLRARRLFSVRKPATAASP